MRTIGIFLGKAGVLETMAVEMMRASVGVSVSESRAFVSRYLAR
jgi:hypothetical protein